MLKDFGNLESSMRYHRGRMGTRKNPDLLNNTRKRRLAAGAGLGQVHVNRVLKQFKNAAKMAKKMSGKGGMKEMQKMMSQMQGGGSFLGMPR